MKLNMKIWYNHVPFLFLSWMKRHLPFARLRQKNHSDEAREVWVQGRFRRPDPRGFAAPKKGGARTWPVKNVWSDVELGHRWGFHRWGYPYSRMVIANWINWGISPCITFRLPTNPLLLGDGHPWCSSSFRGSKVSPKKYSVMWLA